MTEDGVTIEFLSREKLSDHEFEEKLEMILEKVQDNSVLVLEEGWSPDEKRRLIRNSMEEVDDEFPGIEFLGLDSQTSRIEKAKSLLYEKFLDDKYRKGLTIVGNSRVMEKIKEERDTVSFLAKMEEQNNN